MGLSVRASGDELHESGLDALARSCRPRERTDASHPLTWISNTFCWLSSGGAIETSVRSLGGGRVDEDGSGEVFAPQEMILDPRLRCAREKLQTT